MASCLLEVRDLRYERSRTDAGDAFVLEVDELELQAGEAIGIVGPSGCGKSTLVDLLALLRRPASVGRFRLLDEDLASLWKRNALDACTLLRAVHIGVVLQTGGLLPSLSARENILLPQRLQGRLDLDWLDTLLRMLDLKGLDRRLPAQLSIGQRQRVAVARALAHRPALVLADEPTASLGVEHAPAALDLLLRLAADSGAAVLVVSHDIPLLESRRVPMRRCAWQGGAVRLEAAT
ncbi:ABC transporter ATP-binding protein [Variovorax sp. JS1663]|uniref:ABC transporter ATP-binding protein n=1 Tax=Variovorax sp. JS1663 TaxID=1851577 RepID=UPI000B3489C1|nr:ATP-binding cassette domain-containing protein [Variovorax sp. JS1663]